MWMKSNTSKAGMYIYNDGRHDRQAHSGNGQWEYLVARAPLSKMTATTIDFHATFYDSGTVSVSSGDYIEIANVQVERNVTGVATPFENRSYGQEMAACQRYFQVFTESGDTTFGTAVAYTGNAAYDGTQQIFPVEMRASPTRSTSGSWYASDGLGSDFGVTSFYGNNTKWGYQLGFGVSSGLTTGRWYSIRALNGSGSQLKFDAEL